MKRQKIEQESQIHNLSKENKILRQKNDNHNSFLVRKDQIITELEQEVVKMREKSQSR